MKTLGALLCTLLVAFVYAQGVTPLNTEMDLRALAEDAMKMVVAGDYKAAFESLTPYWPVLETEINELASTTVMQRRQLAPRFGESLGYELIDSEDVGDSLIQLTYIEKTERLPLRWVFRFYKPTDSWILNSIEWSDDVEPLFVD